MDLLCYRNDFSIGRQMVGWGPVMISWLFHRWFNCEHEEVIFRFSEKQIAGVAQALFRMDKSNPILEAKGSDCGVGVTFELTDGEGTVRYINE